MKPFLNFTDRHLTVENNDAIIVVQFKVSCTFKILLKLLKNVLYYQISVESTLEPSNTCSNIDVILNATIFIVTVLVTKDCVSHVKLTDLKILCYFLLLFSREI